MELLEHLAKEAGVDVERSLDRFGHNQSLYLKFLRKFIEDPNYASLVEALAEENYDKALVYAHTLKGVSANLGMEELSRLCAKLVAGFRAGEYEGLDLIAQQLSERYQAIIRIILTQS